MLKAKGLERSFIVLVYSGSRERKDLYQLFIGASRAIGKICVYLMEEK